MQYTAKSYSLQVCGQLHAADGVLATVEALDGVDGLQLAQQLDLPRLQQELPNSERLANQQAN